MKRQQYLNRGFTLVELMIVIIVLSILASIAYPSYSQYVLRANRSEGQAMLNDAAARQERYFAQNNVYVTATTDISKLGRSATSTSGKYALTVSSTNGYTFTATPQGGQAKDTGCGNLTLDAAGTRGRSGTTPINDCWK